MFKPQNKIENILDILNELKEDDSISKNFKKVIDNVLNILNKCDNKKLSCDKALSELEKISDDSSVDPSLRTQVWNIIHMLENISSS